MYLTVQYKTKMHDAWRVVIVEKATMIQTHCDRSKLFGYHTTTKREFRKSAKLNHDNQAYAADYFRVRSTAIDYTNISCAGSLACTDICNTGHL